MSVLEVREVDMKRQGLGWTVQTLPVGDIKEHKTNFPEDCECKVRIDDKTGVIMHDSFDRREVKHGTKY